MAFNATFNNISVISLRLVLLVEETEYPEKTTDLSQVTDKLYLEYPEKTTDLSQVTDKLYQEYLEKTTDLSQVTDKLYHVPGENHRPVARGPGENHRPVASH